MKRTISALILLCLMCSLPAWMAGCQKADRSGEWGAYYEAFTAFADDMKKDTRYLCIDNANVEEENRKGLYDLFYEYCKDNGMSVLEGDWITLHGMRLLSDSSEFTDGYLISFTEAKWSKDRREVTFVVSMKTTAAVSSDNLGGSVTVTKQKDGWKAVKEDGGSLHSGKAGAYYAVFAYYLQEAGMDGLKNILALEPHGVESDALPDLKTLITSYAGKQGYQFMEADWEGLRAGGYLDSGNVFTEGYLLSFDDPTWSADGKTFEVTSWMKEGDMRALGGIFTVTWQNDAWQVTDVTTMMS